MSTSNVPTLADLFAQTDAVEQAVHAGEWQQAAALEAERRSQIAQFLTANAAALGEAGNMRPGVAELQVRGNRLLGEAHHCRRKLIFESAALQRGHSALRLYANAARDGEP
jgi:hypothetical protein